jgi:diguanylate cyclase (GGDEF)-like protein
MSLRKRILVYLVATALLPLVLIILYPLSYSAALGPFFNWVVAIAVLFMVLLFLNVVYLYQALQRIYGINTLLKQMSDERPIKINLTLDGSKDELSQLRNSIITMYQKMQDNNQNLNAVKVDAEMKYAQYYTIQYIQSQIGQELESDNLLGVITDVVLGTLGARHCSFHMLDETAENLIIRADSGSDSNPGRLRPIRVDSEELIARCWRNQKSETQKELLQPDKEGNSRTDTLSIVVIPLKGHDHCLGVMKLEFESIGSIGNDMTQFAESIANEISFSVENAYLYGEMKRMAVHDALTGAYNRLYLMNHLKQVFSGEPELLSILILDLDHFKKVNDKYGHLAGDMVLKTTVHIIQKLLLPGSVLARYGGEEFVVVLPGVNQTDAVDWAELMRLSVAKYSFLTENKVQIPVTLSAGLATYPTIGTGAENLLQLADEALYRAKETGRNKVCVAGKACQ